MAYTVPTKSAFAAAFPAFATVTDDQYNFWSAKPGRMVDAQLACLGDDANLTCMLLTAHYLVLAGIGAGADAQAAAAGAGAYQRIKSGSIDLDKGAPSDAAVRAGEFGTTSYGLRAWPMLSACLRGPRVTDTGILPERAPDGTIDGYEGPIW